MTSTPAAQYRRFIGPYELNITARGMDSQPPEVYTALIIATTKLWVYLSTCIQNGIKELPEQVAFITAEQAVQKNFEGVDFDSFDEARVTVFDWNHVLHLTIHSNTLPQPTLDLFWAMEAAKQELATLYPPPQTAVNAQKPVSTPTQGTNTPHPPENPVEGAIVGTRLPVISKPQYADGQMVIFTINKIEAGAEKGSPVFKLWSTLGGRGATHTIYKLDTKGQPHKAYEAALPVLSTLKLDFEHPEAQGSWRLVVQSKHSTKDGSTKEYMNLVSLTPI